MKRGGYGWRYAGLRKRISLRLFWSRNESDTRRPEKSLMMSTGATHDTLEVGVISPEPIPTDGLGAGEVGFFSPGSYWPFGIAAFATLAGVGIVFWMVWLIALGIICVIFSACALLFEYYTGTRRTAEH